MVLACFTYQDKKMQTKSYRKKDGSCKMDENCSQNQSTGNVNVCNRGNALFGCVNDALNFFNFWIKFLTPFTMQW